MTTPSAPGGTFRFPGTELAVRRVGYGAMQLAGPGVWGPPRDHDTALAVLRAAVAAGVDHIDTSDFYGPHVTNQLIREALHPYPAGLVIVTKLGARRTADGSWVRANGRDELFAATHDNLRHLGLNVLEVANLRTMASGSERFEEQVTAMAELRAAGLIRHVGLSGVSLEQIAQARRIVPIVCVQNRFNLAQRDDAATVDATARAGIAYVPYFPLGGFTPLQSAALSAVAMRRDATPLQIAQAWLLHRSPNILLISGTSSVDHLRENLGAAAVTLTDEDMRELTGGGGE